LKKAFSETLSAKAFTKTIKSGEPDCYKDGCLVLVAYETGADFQRFDLAFTHADGFSPEFGSDGKARAGWVFFSFGD
jgi:hypothetical protein